MTYEVVDNFAAGLDIRKSPMTAPGGTLTRLKNAVINPGGEIEKRRAFVKIGSNILAGSFGLAATESTLYVFGRNVDAADAGARRSRRHPEGTECPERCRDAGAVRLRHFRRSDLSRHD